MRGALVGLLLALLAGTALADDSVAAREHYNRGSSLFDLGHFAEAAKEFEAAYEAKNDPALLFNVAQSYRFAGQYEKALLAYRAFLRRMPDAPGRAQVEASITKLQELIEQQKSAGTRPPTGTMAPQAEPSSPSSRSGAPAVAAPSAQESTKPRHSTLLIASGVALLALGAAGVAVGAYDVTLDGKGTCNLAPGQVRCADRYNTLALGGALIGAGAAAAIGGAVAIAVDAHRSRASLHASVQLGPTTAAVVVGGRF